MKIGPKILIDAALLDYHNRVGQDKIKIRRLVIAPELYDDLIDASFESQSSRHWLKDVGWYNLFYTTFVKKEVKKKRNQRK